MPAVLDGPNRKHFYANDFSHCDSLSSGIGLVLLDPRQQPAKFTTRQLPAAEAADTRRADLHRCATVRTRNLRSRLRFRAPGANERPILAPYARVLFGTGRNVPGIADRVV